VKFIPNRRKTKTKDKDKTKRKGCTCVVGRKVEEKKEKNKRKRKEKKRREGNHCNSHVDPSLPLSSLFLLFSYKENNYIYITTFWSWSQRRK
jgi:hypothetical protein